MTDIPKKGNAKVTVYQSRVQAGFPSPADDYKDGTLDLNELLINNPPATFFVRVQGDSMIDAGIFDGDLLIVDRSLEARSGQVIIAMVNNDFTVKRFIKVSDKQVTLQAENKQHKDIEVGVDSDFSIWGVVTNSIHSF
ncbi:MAG: translesion error-prone DNA polymerase V autoproteolytic subunit [Bacteriovoracaceae bacterium]|nr:translesion error-prone DNA polymerase V autoproteolytic subunit [Bacteriovoracaceae bacterium]